MFGVLMFLLILALVFAGVIVGVVFLIRASSQAGKKRLDEASTTLLPLIAGTIHGEQMVGTYMGANVSATMVAGTLNNTGDVDDRRHFFVTTLAAGPGSADWSLQHVGDGFLHTGQKSWHVKTKDHELEARLVEAGALDAIGRWTAGAPSVTYRAKDGALSATSPGARTKTWPDAAQFANCLDVLAALAACNRRANAPAPAGGPAVST